METKMAKLQCFDPDFLYPPSEAAPGLGFTVQTLAKWRCLGCGPEYRKQNGRITYLGKKLNDYQATAEIGGTPAPAEAA
jgi:hypothetical protein